MSFDGAQVVEKQDAVEMIDLMLRGARLESRELDRVGAAVAVERLERHRERALDFAVQVGDRQTPLFRGFRSEERREGKSVDLGGRRIIKKKKRKKRV